MAKAKDQKGQQKRKSPAGRRSKYLTNVQPKLIAIEGWARDGLIDRQIAHNCGVAYSTFRTYIKKYPELAAALFKGKDVADYEVESSLFKKATGYTIRLQKAKVLSDGTVVEYEEDMHVPPDTTAAIFWLINRTRDTGKWMDTRRVEHSGPGGGPMEIASWVDLVLLADKDEDDEAEATTESS